MARASILLLDDDRQIRDLRTEVLAGDGYPVRACASLDGLHHAACDKGITVAIADASGESRTALSAASFRAWPAPSRP